jgi:hypothetical protein
MKVMRRNEIYFILKWGSKSIKLMLFERNILRKTFGPTKERDGTWRIKTIR